ncbi:MAG: FAD-binding oxidoreductase, partial [Bacteroidota bacterium]
NLVGSTETHAREVVISMERMRTIEEVDEQSRTLTTQAGAILENVQNAAAEKGLLFPLNFGAKGSAQIGGAISTNAGGLRVLRYGMTRNLVLGLEAVLADGTIVSSLKKIIKDNSAYDIKQLFVGSEGTLGIVTRTVLRLVEAPKSRVSAFVGFNEYDKVVSFLRYMDQGLAGTLSGFELIWKDAYEGLTNDPSVSRPPLPLDYQYYVLLEGLGSDQEQDQIRLEALLEEALNNDLIVDAAVAYSESDLNWFWHIRENVDALVTPCKYDQHFDISLPISLIGKTVSSITEQLKKVEGITHINAFGHVADGNIHYIIGKADNSTALKNSINDIIYGPLKELGGSVSAEHGIGLHKKAYLPLCRTSEEITLMKNLKQSLDPKNLLNRGKVLDL